MADILVNLYTAIKAKFDSYKVSGYYAGDLSWLRYAAQPGEINLQALWGKLPCVLYFWTNTPFILNAGEGRCRHDNKIYYFQMNCIFEMHDITYGARGSSVEKVQDHVENALVIEDIFSRETFNGTALATWQTRMWAGQPTFPGFTMDGIGWIYSINHEFAYLWQDRRSS